MKDIESIEQKSTETVGSARSMVNNDGRGIAVSKLLVSIKG